MESRFNPALEVSDLAVWQALALSDAELEKADLIELNLAVARGIPVFADLDPAPYIELADRWIADFKAKLPQMERGFQRTPAKWRDDIRFFRIGMLACYLGTEVGIRYIEEQKRVASIHYKNPGDLFINGLIDTRLGSCGNMAALHVALCRRMGWPVSLASAKSHFVSRFDDGEVIHNIEAAQIEDGSFGSETDEWYMQRYAIPRKAIECGSDLRRLSVREMVAMFIALRARHFRDVGEAELAERDYLLSRVIFPQHRQTFIASMMPSIRRGAALFDPHEVGHPDSLFEDFAPSMAPDVHSQFRSNPIKSTSAVGLSSMPLPIGSFAFSQTNIAR
jgi:hypothetical protein